jgi:hypothetical protein
MTCLIVAPAAMTNVRRIQRYRLKPAPPRPNGSKTVKRGNAAVGSPWPHTFLAPVAQFCTWYSRHWRRTD